MKIDAKTPEVTEIPGVLEKLSRKTRSETGKRAFIGIYPSKTAGQSIKRQCLLKAYIRHRDTRGELPWENSLRPAGPLFEAARQSSFLSGEELLCLRKLIGLAIRIREVVHKARRDIPGIEDLASGIRDMSVEFAELQVLAEDGELYDQASPSLERIRRELRDVRSRARARCAELSSSQNLVQFLQDRAIHLRKGRLALLVRVEDAGRFEGMILDRSGSGKGVYMEPKEIVVLNNRIEMLRSNETEEVRKILSRLTAMVLEKKNAILEAENAVALVDVMHACAHTMEEPGWSLPEIQERSRFHFRNLWNPLIGQACVPIDIHCGERFRQLVITGPNTGGKTVVLKSVSIAVFLALSGLPVPAAEGSVVGGIDLLAADIGDEQGIEQNLSTFSSHVSRIIMMMENAGPDSLLLLDELGAGTDPQEGAALGMAILEKLREKRCLVLATTHHNPIKRFAVISKGVESASMEFDPVTFSPTFDLLMGVPGKSNAILIARRLGMPDDIIGLARENLSGENKTAEKLMEELFDKQVELEKAGKEVAAERRMLAERKKELEDRMGSISLKEEKLLLAADGKAREVLEEAEKKAREMLKNLENAAGSAARREFEKERKGVVSLKKKISGREEAVRLRKAEREGVPGVGDTVKIAETEARGVVESIKGNKAVVAAGPLRIDVPLKDLVRVKELGKSARKVPAADNFVPAPRGVPSSIMVRGMTLDEAMPEVEVYLDRAFRAGYGEVLVIHGRGEGILRRAVHSLCGSLSYVTDYRLGNAGEGGYGVTVVSFRKG